jgi:N utilization substance protein B
MKLNDIPMQLNRRTAREIVMKALYALELSHNTLEHIIETVIKPVLKKEDKLMAFAEELFLKTVRDTKMADEIISSLADNWDIKRIAIIDKMILRMSVCEMVHFPDIPTKVTINEAIEIAKSYSTSKSGPFINGILDAASEKLRKEGKINKEGIGLMESPLNR